MKPCLDEPTIQEALALGIITKIEAYEMLKIYLGLDEFTSKKQNLHVGNIAA